MLKKLKARWKVNGINLVLIITTFALGGSLCGYAGRKILLVTGLEKGVLWICLYILLITILWPICVLIISVPLGQYTFFKRYILKIWHRMAGRADVENQKTVRIAVFASGAGTNAEKILYSSFNRLPNQPKEKMPRPAAVYKVELIVCNNPAAGVIEIARKAGIPVLLIQKDRFLAGNHYLPELKQYQIDFIVLAGFLWKLPPALIEMFPKKIINIHPALLPKFGGKGMYGNRVHEAVIASGDKESGISIHFVDELYDHGEVIFQAKCTVEENDTGATLANKIHQLEHAHYPAILARVVEEGRI